MRSEIVLWITTHARIPSTHLIGHRLLNRVHKAPKGLENDPIRSFSEWLWLWTRNWISNALAGAKRSLVSLSMASVNLPKTLILNSRHLIPHLIFTVIYYCLSLLCIILELFWNILFSLKNHYSNLKTMHVTAFLFRVFSYSHGAWKTSNGFLTTSDLALFCSVLCAVFSERSVALTAKYQSIKTVLLFPRFFASFRSFGRLLSTYMIICVYENKER